MGGSSSSVIPVVPPENPDTYRWRGDTGVLDRLAYSANAREIPRNWEMTTLDAANIALKLQRSGERLEGTSERNLITAPDSDFNIEEQPRDKRSVEELADSASEATAPPPKKKR